MPLFNISSRSGDIQNDPNSLLNWLDRLFLAVKDRSLRGAFFSSLAADQTGATSAAFNQVKVDTEAFDVENWLDSTTNKGRYTPQVAGKYWFGGCVRAAAVANDNTISALYKNGTRMITGSYPGVGQAGFFGFSTVTGLIDMNGTTDYVELYGYIPATITVINGASTFFTNFQGFRVCA